MKQRLDVVLRLIQWQLSVAYVTPVEVLGLLLHYDVYGVSLGYGIWSVHVAIHPL